MLGFLKKSKPEKLDKTYLVNIVAYEQWNDVRDLSWLKRGSLILAADPAVYNQDVIFNSVPFVEVPSFISGYPNPANLKEFKEFSTRFTIQYIDSIVLAHIQNRTNTDYAVRSFILENWPNLEISKDGNRKLKVYIKGQKVDFTIYDNKATCETKLKKDKELFSRWYYTRMTEHVLPAVRDNISRGNSLTLLINKHDLESNLFEDFLNRYNVAIKTTSSTKPNGHEKQKYMLYPAELQISPADATDIIIANLSN